MAESDKVSLSKFVTRLYMLNFVLPGEITFVIKLLNKIYILLLRNTGEWSLIAFGNIVFAFVS